jgi:hypothetical protein
MAVDLGADGDAGRLGNAGMVMEGLLGARVDAERRRFFRRTGGRLSFFPRLRLGRRRFAGPTLRAAASDR